jgi:hypothetical protein
MGDKTLDQAFRECGVAVQHHFAGGVYIKATEIPAGVVLTQHKHKYDHLSLLAQGRAVVVVDGVRAEHIAPAVLNIAAGKVHAVEAQTDVLWYCIHASDVADDEVLKEAA